jgi:hypothetical protein
MKKLKPLLTIIFINVISCETKKKDNNEEKLDNLLKKTNKIEFLAYIDRNSWDGSDNPNYRNVSYIKNRKLDIKEKYIKNRMILNNKQVKEFKEKLNHCNSVDWVAACYDPRHAIIFYNDKDEIFGYVEMCFSCNNYDASKNVSFIGMCTVELETLFKEFGITYFEDDEKDKELIKLKQKELEERNKKLDSKIIKKNE